MTEWFETLTGLQDRVWQLLKCGVADRHAPARQPTLATVGPDGRPEARTVVLRRVERSTALLEVYTDSLSDKMKSLKTSPWAALHVWEPKLDLQIRLQADVTPSEGDAVADRWDPLPEAARLSYGVVPPPGTPIDAALDYEKSADQGRFCVLTLALVHIDVVHLGEAHRRAAYRADDGWAGQWLVP
ncbi:Pyridoxamine 5'-phosphate oxidase [Loktanella atrilutea]|uniref:Pyridoxamine 5'-phosphate oxidase n=1 Tax=Loktanella atrilutea TaxID=366533 RepID=A0A1M4YY46_LOKAT|nr:pyridoxamine 5'-phosphate oxidase family protein [Loktanella atrilutea]SHF10618.1 Pyridoxamine 5'-phosphate oxidase [Loktanella atrilutea]